MTQNLQTSHQKCVENTELCWEKKLIIFPWTNDMLQKENSFDNKKLPVAGRNFLSKENILGHWKKTSCCNKKLPITGGNFLSQQEISCPRKKLPVPARHFMSQQRNVLSNKKNSCYSKILPITRRNFLLQQQTFCYSKKLPVTERNILPQKRLLVTGRNFLSEEESSGHLLQNTESYMNQKKIWMNYAWISLYGFCYCA